MKAIEKLFGEMIKEEVDGEVWAWLEDCAQKITTESGALTLNKTFPQIPRKTGKSIINPKKEQLQTLQENISGASVEGWSVDRLARVWIIQHISSADKETYRQKIERLFLTAEMNELVALYSALPYLEYPETWVHRCTEGIRNNIGTVLEAVMYENPYPSKWLSEQAWNQLVMKAFFTDKNVDRIYNLDKRANPVLAEILTDYAHERWQAHRKINPQLWRLVGRFINSKNFDDLQKLYREGDPLEKKAAILACSESEFAPAKQLVAEATGATKILDNLSWHSLLNESNQTSNN